MVDQFSPATTPLSKSYFLRPRAYLIASKLPLYFFFRKSGETPNAAWPEVALLGWPPNVE
jgi:hypothetical protein